MLTKLLAKTEEDPEFRHQMVADPKSALKEAFDIDIPADFNLVIHEDDARTAHLVIPASAELTDTRLQNAIDGAGGTFCNNTSY